MVTALLHYVCPADCGRYEELYQGERLQRQRLRSARNTDMKIAKASVIGVLMLTGESKEIGKRVRKEVIVQLATRDREGRGDYEGKGYTLKYGIPKWVKIPSLINALDSL